MQALISLPDSHELEARGGLENSLCRKVSGIPLLERVILTAAKMGAGEILLLRPAGLREKHFRTFLNSRRLAAVSVRTLELGKPFDPENPADWNSIAHRLESRFLWLPWNRVLDRGSLKGLIAAGESSPSGARFACGETPGSSARPEQAPWEEAAHRMPMVVAKDRLLAGGGAEESAERKGGSLSAVYADPDAQVVPARGPAGVVVESNQTARLAERELLRRSGKDWDGIYSGFNRWLSRPLVHWLSKTRATPNQVSFAGLFAAMLAAYAYAQGHWSAYALGGVLYFISVLFDEMDGMLARVTFQDSPFGTWLETYLDYAGFGFLFLGMTVGLYRESGVLWLALGGALLAGVLLSFLVLARQRKISTDPGKPQEARIRLYQRLENDWGNPLSRFARRMQFVAKKATIGPYLVLFSALGGLKLFFVFSAVGANLVWILSLYFNRHFWSAGNGKANVASAAASLAGGPIGE